MNNKFVVMGISGCGKSSIGSMLAEALGLQFFDSDDYHPMENVEKMRSGQPLTDEDRRPWLNTLKGLIQHQPEIVLACSALKPEYRQTLRNGNPSLKFIYLKGDFDTIWARHCRREGHYFNGAGMLKSQFDTLVEPSVDEAIVIDIDSPPEHIVELILEKLDARQES